MNSFLKSVIFWILIWMTFSVDASPSSGSLRITIPVIPETGQVKGFEMMKKGAVSLQVNGQPRMISGIKKIEKSMITKSDLGREFILSYFADRFNNDNRKGLSYFITEIMTDTDRLVFVSYANVYRFENITNKERLILHLSRIIERDCADFRSRKISFEKSLTRDLCMIESYLSSGRDTLVNAGKESKRIFAFLNTFPEQFNRYLEMTLVFSLARLGDITGPIKSDESEKWWIHIDNHDLNGLLLKARKVLHKIESMVIQTGSLREPDLRESARLYREARPMHDTNAVQGRNDILLFRLIEMFKKTIFSNENFRIADLILKFQRSEICFNSIISCVNQNHDMEYGLSENPLSASVLNLISRRTGGLSVQTRSAEEGFREIARRRLTFYRLDFLARETDQELKIDLYGPDGILNGFIYPGTLSQSVLKDVGREGMERGCRIMDFMVRNRYVFFRVTGFKQGLGMESGLVKVRVCIRDKSGNEVYSRVNTLKVSSGRDDVKINIRMPSALAGSHSVNLAVTDLIARNCDTLDRNVDF